MKRSDIPVLDDLRAFEAVARLGSVRAAAEEMALTHGAISRRISKLARAVGTALLVPVGRGIKLSPAGEKLGFATAHALEVLTATLNEIRTPRPQESVLLSCERSVAMRWLIPRLSEFQDTNPGIPVHLSVGGGSLDFEHQGVSLAIRRIDFPIDPNWSVENLFEERIGPVMQPSMRDRFLAGEYIALGSKTRPNAWKDWLAKNSSITPPREIRFMDHHFLMAEAAASGLGVAMCPMVLAVDDDARGRLVAPLGYAPDGSYYGLIYPTAVGLSEGDKAVISWLLRVGSTLADK